MQFRYFHENSSLRINRFFDNYILTDNTTLIQNNIAPLFLKSQNLSFDYFYNNLNSDFSINASIYYQENKNSIISILQIENDYLINHYSVLNKNINNYGVLFSISKMFYDLSSKFKLSFNHNYYEYLNVINNSSLNNNKNKQYKIGFNYTSAFDGFLNIVNEFKYNYTVTENNRSSINNSSIINFLTFILKPLKQTSLRINFNYYKPSININNEVLIINSSIDYKTKNKKYDFFLELNNITNKKTQSYISISDYQKTTITQKLINFNFNTGMSFRF